MSERPSLRLPQASASLRAAPAWRRDPYKPLFGLGMLLAWAGVLHWIFFALGIIPEYRSIFHALAQIEGFLTCFALGFLFTFVPRRTGTAPPAVWQMLVALGCPVAVVILSWFEKWAVSQIFWLLLLGTLIQFAAKRMLSSQRRDSVPASFVWVGFALAFATFGSVLAGVGAALGEEWFWLHDIGRALVLQGMFTGFVLGTGGLLVPAITRGVDPTSAPQRLPAGVHLALGLLYAASFWADALVSLRAGFGVRFLVVLVVLLAIRAHLRPTIDGFHRRLVFLAVWMLPLGNLIVALAPEYRRAGLHVVFIGCFALLVFAVSTHVVLSHGARPEQLHGRPRQLVVAAVLLGFALCARVLVDVDPARTAIWIATAGTSFLCATIAWAALVFRKAPVSA
ncbi:MAG: NnrS family protein [Myxococcales bacterium]